MRAFKRKLADNRLTTPLFDTQLYTKHIEAAYTAIYERYQAGLAPDHIIVPNLINALVSSEAKSFVKAAK